MRDRPDPLYGSLGIDMHRSNNARSTMDNYSIEPPSGKQAKSILPSINGFESKDSLFGESKSVRNLNLDASKMAIHLGASTVADTRM